jgi:deoxyribodipyrimidine photo-lyase
LKATPKGTIVWFRQDLRLHDNPALKAACDRGGWVIPLYVRSDTDEQDWPAGGATQWWLHRSLTLLGEALAGRGSRLLHRRGSALDIVHALVRQSGADAVYWNRRYEPAIVARDAAIKQSLRADDIACESFNATLLTEPWNVRSQTDKPYRVFTPFKKRQLECLDVAVSLARPRRLASPATWPDAMSLDDLDLLPRNKWYLEMEQHWRPGETGALHRARRFLARPITNYDVHRNQPATHGTSSLSPHLHFGEISVRQLWHMGQKAADRRKSSKNAWRESLFASELIWREFAYHLLYYQPRTPLEPLDSQFEHFAWQPDKRVLRAWQNGRTGFPIVDAGMRQLWSLGWMHNRVRMIAASLLVKNLRQPWLDGARWFWDTLVDADLAANTLNWQWIAGCGADAAPYFRIFNPVTQGENFDPTGDYVRRWVPELAAVPAQYIHAPHLAPAAVLQAANVQIGKTYPAPLVDVKASRQQALAAYQAMRGARPL